jgi:preprotein translocase subunit YajC
MTISDVGPLFAMGAIPDSGNLLVQFAPFAIVLAIFYFIILLPTKRKQQKVQEFLDALKVNDKVVTTGGIYGQVTRIGGDTVQLQVADKVRIEVARASVGGYQGQDPVQESESSRAS